MSRLPPVPARGRLKRSPSFVLRGAVQTSTIEEQNDQLIKHSSALVFDGHGNPIVADPHAFGETIVRLFNEVSSEGLPSYRLTVFDHVMDDYYHGMSDSDYQQTILWTQGFLTEAYVHFFPTKQLTLPDWICRNLPFDFRALEAEEVSLRSAGSLEQADKLKNKILLIIAAFFTNYILALSLLMAEYYCTLRTPEARRRSWDFSTYLTRKLLVPYNTSDPAATIERMREVFKWYSENVFGNGGARYIEEYNSWIQSEEHAAGAGMGVHDKDDPHLVISVIQDQIEAVRKNAPDKAKIIQDSLNHAIKKHEDLKWLRILYARNILLTVLSCVYQEDGEAYAALIDFALNSPLHLNRNVSMPLFQGWDTLSAAQQGYCIQSELRDGVPAPDRETQIAELKRQEDTFWTHIEATCRCCRNLSVASRIVKCIYPQKYPIPLFQDVRNFLMSLQIEVNSYLDSVAGQARDFASYRANRRWWQPLRKNVETAFLMKTIINDALVDGRNPDDMHAAIDRLCNLKSTLMQHESTWSMIKRLFLSLWTTSDLDRKTTLLNKRPDFLSAAENIPKTSRARYTPAYKTFHPLYTAIKNVAVRVPAPVQITEALALMQQHLLYETDQSGTTYEDQIKSKIQPLLNSSDSSPEVEGLRRVVNPVQAREAELPPLSPPVDGQISPSAMALPVSYSSNGGGKLGSNRPETKGGEPPEPNGPLRPHPLSLPSAFSARFNGALFSEVRPAPPPATPAPASPDEAVVVTDGAATTRSQSVPGTVTESQATGPAPVV